MSEHKDLTRVEVIKMMRVLKSLYPQFYMHQTEEDLKLIINVWLARLSLYPKELVVQAFYKVLDTCKTPPTLAHVIEQINAIQEIAQDNAYELWQQLSEAIYQASILAGRFNYDAIPLGETKTQGQLAREELDKLFNNLAPIIKEYVSSKQGLLDLADVDADFERARFLKAVPQLKERIKLKSQIPQSTKNILIAEKKKQIKQENN